MRTGKKNAAVASLVLLCAWANVTRADELESRSNPVANGAIVIDGDFTDWAGVSAYPADPAGDSPAGDQDWAQVAVAHDETFIYVRLDRQPGSIPFSGAGAGSTTGGQGYWIWLDTDKDLATGVSLAGVRPFSIGGEFNFGGPTRVNRWGAGGLTCGLGGFSPAQVSPMQPNEVEMVVSRESLGNPTEFDLQFVGENSGDFYPDDPSRKFHYSTVAALPDPLPAEIVASRCNPVANGTMVMDGDVSDWMSVAAFPADPTGDGGTTQDWLRVWVAHDDANFYFKLERAAGSAPVSSPGYWGWIDTDRNDTTGVTSIGAYPFSVGGEFNFGGSAAINEWNSGGGYVQTFGWAGVGEPGPLSVELAIRRAEIGDPPDFNLIALGETSGDYYPDGALNNDYYRYSVHPPGPTGGDPVVVASRSNPVPTGSIIADGDLADWAGVEPFPIDAAGDGGTGQDWVQAWMAHDDDNFYFRIERTGSSIGFSSAPAGQGYWTVLDTDNDTATGFVGFGPRNFSIGGEFNISGSFAFNAWNNTGCYSGPVTFATSAGAATEAELSILKSSLGNPAEFNIAFMGENSGDLYPDGAAGGDYFHYTFGTPIAPLPAGMLQSLSNAVADGAITIDGSLGDWASITPFMADAAGDGGAGQDWVQVWVAHDSTKVYLRFKRADGSLPFASLGYWGLIDTDRTANTGLQVTSSVGAEYNTGGINVLNGWIGTNQFTGQIPLSPVGEALPTTYEVSVARADLGDPSRFRVVFVSENSTDYYPDGANSNETFVYTLTPCPTPFADADEDGDVDMADFAAWQRCYTGPGGMAAGACTCFDRDFGQGDGDVDLDDLSAFTNCASGPAITADPGCE